MKNTISPCCIRWKPNVRVYWKTRADESSKWETDDLYWGKLPTGELEKLVEWSSRERGERIQLCKKPWLRDAGKTDNDFRAAIIARIKNIKSDLLEKKRQKLSSIEPRRRAAAQTSHELTPSVQSWKHFTNLKVKFESMMKTAPQWDDATRAAVLQNLEKFSKFFAELAGKLSG